jgi:hypothetical protein
MGFTVPNLNTEQFSQYHPGGPVLGVTQCWRPYFLATLQRCQQFHACSHFWRMCAMNVRHTFSRTALLTVQSPGQSKRGLCKGSSTMSVQTSLAQRGAFKVHPVFGSD